MKAFLSDLAAGAGLLLATGLAAYIILVVPG
jgi:hypothetical protein